MLNVSICIRKCPRPDQTHLYFSMALNWKCLLSLRGRDKACCIHSIISRPHLWNFTRYVIVIQNCLHKMDHTTTINSTLISSKSDRNTHNPFHSIWISSTKINYTTTTTTTYTVLTIHFTIWTNYTTKKYHLFEQLFNLTFSRGMFKIIRLKNILVYYNHKIEKFFIFLNLC